MTYVCTVCGRRADASDVPWKCGCGGLWDLDFEPAPFDERLIDQKEFSMFRYRAFFPLENPLWRGVSLGEGMTAAVPFAPGLWLKLDYAMPTLSFKDRGAAALVWLCKTLGVSRVLQDSSGNAGNAVAAYCARAGISCEIFVPAGTSPSKIEMIRAHGAVVTVFSGTRDETADACREKASREGTFYASHVFNPMFYQGTKTFIYEIFEQLGRIPDHLFIPVGNGTLLLGVELALQELLRAKKIRHLPHVFAVQSERCAPLANTRRVARDIVPMPTLAEGIAIGKPMRAAQILKIIEKNGWDVVTIPEETILPAHDALAHGGYFVETTTAATYAAYLETCKKRPFGGDVLIPLTGAGLKSRH